MEGIKIRLEVYFEIEKDFDPVNFRSLDSLGYHCYDKTRQKYKWFFPAKNLKRVKEIVGVPLEAEEIDLSMFKKGLREDISVGSFKGDDEVEIIEFPSIFRVIEHRKLGFDADGKPQIKEIKTDVNKELVVTIWDNVIKKQPLGKPILTGTVIENIFGLLDLKVSKNQPRALRDTASYQRYFYKPMQVLRYKGCINHHKYGAIERVADEFAIQSTFREVDGY